MLCEDLMGFCRQVALTHEKSTKLSIYELKND
jgi:hypothetical protein